jgi:hypothetical protein
VTRLLQPRLARLLTGGEGAGQAKLRGDTVNTMSRVKVLDYNHLVTGGHAFAGGNNGPGEEQLPDLGHVRIHEEALWETTEKTHSVPSGTILGLDRFHISNPVTVPSPEGAGVVNTDSINAGRLSAIARGRTALESKSNLPLEFESGLFQALNIIPKRS